MARTKNRRALARSGPRTVKPIVIRQTKVVKPKHKRHHRGGMGLGGFLSSERSQMGIAGAVIGYIDKQGWNLPKLPVLGEHGTIAVAAYFLSDGGRNKMAANVCTAAMVLAGFEFAKTGTISGADEDFTGGL